MKSGRRLATERHKLAKSDLRELRESFAFDLLEDLQRVD
jgi:hypothetical protein